MQNKQIFLIVSYYFFPTNTPRAFRAYELAKELSRLGHGVTVIIPQNDYDYKEMESAFDIRIIQIPSGFFLNRNLLSTKNSEKELKKNGLSGKIKFLVQKMIKPIYFEGILTEFSLTLFQYLKSHRDKYDCVISIGLPMSVHIAVAMSRKKNNIATKYIADYGDPFSYNSDENYPFYLIRLEKYILKWFDCITIPVEQAKQAFEPLGIKEKIHIIPQGFDFSETKLHVYKSHKIPHFSFAGNFYEDIRNPKQLLDFLVEYTGDFRFDIYTNVNYRNNIICLTPYIEPLKGKMFIKPFVARIECIALLSSNDFLININNASTVQSPSKLIDYALAKRPVFNMSHYDFDSYVFKQFLLGDYHSDYLKDFDVAEYNIKNIAEKFIKLCDN